MANPHCSTFPKLIFYIKSPHPFPVLFKQECKKKLLRKPTYVIVRGGRQFCGRETGEEPDDPVTSPATDLRDLGKATLPRLLTNIGCLFLGRSAWDSSGGCSQKC